MFAQWMITSYHTTALRSITISSEVRPYYSSRTNNSNFLFLSLLFRTQEQNVERPAMLLQNSINWLVWRANSSYPRAATVLALLGLMRAAAKWGCGGTDSVQAIPKGDFFLSPLPNASSFSFGMNFSKSTQAAQHLLLYVQLRYRLTSEFVVSNFVFVCFELCQCGQCLLCWTHQRHLMVANRN